MRLRIFRILLRILRILLRILRLNIYATNTGLVGQILLIKAKFHFFEKKQKRAKLPKSYQYFRLTLVRLSLGLEKCSFLIDNNLNFKLSVFGTDLCEDIATMLSLGSFSASRLAECQYLLSVNKIRLSSVNNTQFLHLWFNILYNKLY